MSFVRFDPAALALLAELPTWDAERYGQHRADLADGVTGPGRDLITDLALRLDPELTVTPRGSVSPLHRDLRFAPPGSPRYKDHLLLTAWRGEDKRTAPTLWLRIGAERAGFASGVGFTPAIRQRWREAVADESGALLAAELTRLSAERGAEVAGDRLKRVPAPHPADHPRAELLRATGFQVRFTDELPDELTGEDFVAWCQRRFDALLPVHRWLVAHVAEPPASDEDVFWDLIDELRGEDPRVDEGTIMGGRCVRVDGQFLALLDRKGRGMVVKLPRERVDELIGDGAGRAFAPAGKVFREWVAIPRRDRRRWLDLLREGITFVG